MDVLRSAEGRSDRHQLSAARRWSALQQSALPTECGRKDYPNNPEVKDGKGASLTHSLFKPERLDFSFGNDKLR
eukprot:15968435-Heterocapsa_arctica.AAC.1